MNATMKRIISLVLCLVLAIGIMPVSAFAAESGETVATVVTEPVAVAVSGIALDQTALEVGVGAEPVTLTATVLPEDATDKTVTWTSSEPGVASVVDGVVTFGYMGEAVITATAGEFSATCAVTVGEGEAAEYAEEDSVVVIAGSDYQKSTSGDTMTSIGAKIKEDYASPFGILMGGDYDAGDIYPNSTHLTNVDNMIEAVFPSIGDEYRIMIQGNHETYGNLSPSRNALLDSTGAHDTDYYGVYAINYEDFGSASSGLKTYLDGKSGYTKPIFVMSHQPLHATSRGDNTKAVNIFNVLNAYEDLNIIFLFGHNHSQGFDAYLGNGSIYLPVGSKITVAGGSEQTLNFTYMNYGYVGYVNGSACTHLTMTAFEITEDEVTVKRYDTSGLHQLKAAGVADSGYNTDTSVIGTEGAVIDLTKEPKTTVENEDKTVSVTAVGLTGLTATKAENPSYDKEVYSAYASYNITPANYEQGKSATVTIKLSEADGFALGKPVYVIDVDGEKEIKTELKDDFTITFTTNHFSEYIPYQLTKAIGYTYELVTSIEAGESYVIVGNDDLAVLMDNSSSIATQTDGLTLDGTTLTSETELTLWTISGTSAGTIVSDQGNGLSYSSSSWNLSGDPDNTFNIASGTNNFSVQVQRSNSYSSKYYFYYDGSEWAKDSNNTQYVRLYKLTGSGGGTVTPSGDTWVTVTEPNPGTVTYTYTQATSITKGQKYVIVGNDNDVALLADGTTMGAQAVTISGTSGSQSMTSTTELTEWTFSGSSSGTVYNGTNYLYSSSSGYAFRIDDSSDTLYFSDGGNYFQIRGSSGSNGYSLYYDGESWATSGRSTRGYVRLFQLTKTEAGNDATNGLFAKITGTLEHAIPRGLTAEQAIATVQGGITGYAYTGMAVPDSDTAEGVENITGQLTFTMQEGYQGTVAGEYAVTISYNGTVLGTAKVIVPEVAITGITVAPASGTVTVGASEAALVGANITVNYEDNTTATVPVTVGMLSGTFDTKTADTYEGLTVTYNNFKFENFTLTVKEKVVNNYPSYPNEGAVKVDKSATGIDFQKTGVARVELSTSGVPMNQGVDILLVLDTSSSMGFQGSLDSGTRIGVLQDCVNALIVNLKKDRPDGSKSDIDIAVVDFAGYLLGHDGTKLDNYIGSQVKSTTADKVGEVLTGGWVDVQSLSDTWGTQNISEKSGTNYDHGLEMAYNLLAQKQADNSDNTRKQFVLFMSDGAPLQYNGVNSNSLDTDWEDWILGNYTVAQVEAIDTIKNSEFYYGNNNGNGQKHWVAEAIKGAPDNQYKIVYHENYTYGSATMATKEVPGLGATMYSVGLALEASNMPTDVAGQEAILKTIASSEDVFYSVTSAAGLQGAFDDFAGAVLYAAENAVFEDQLGGSFNIQMASTTKRLVDGEEFTLNPAPTMEVREYTIWTRAELEDANGNLSEENAKKVGTRKIDEKGNYIYKTLEVVSFNAGGTEAYTGDDKTKNIIDANGVICAKTFWYNNGTATVKVDVDGDGTAETDLAPETFIWKVGTIKSTELALSYYVYLDDSLEGEASAGSYETNKYAILSYDNYLGNPCKKETISPQMAWLSANVSYAYYLVNKDGTPVNANGEEVTFANREIIVHPTIHSEVPLNSQQTENNLEIASTGILGSHYALFDYSAQYRVTVYSQGGGSWQITKGTKEVDGVTVELPATTYVTGYGAADEFSKELSMSEEHDYTHTVVWFAVVWEPEAKDDIVVIDYGLPVDVHVLTNDFFGEFGELIGIAAGNVTDSGNNISTNQIRASGDPVEGTFGTAEVIKPETGANESNSVIRYTLESMEMTEPEVFTYSVEYTNTKLHANNGFYYGTLTVIPATTIYYEDTFLEYAKYEDNRDGDFTNDVVVEDGWSVVGETVEDATQAEDRPGDINFAFDTVIDANNVYGNDGAYTTMAEHSLGSARKVSVDAGTYATATFTFYGTGFDVISMTSNTTGTIIVDVYDAEENEVRSTMVDTFYGMNEDGSYSENNPAAIYQVPVIKIFDLDYAQYTVKITATYAKFLDHTGTENADGTADGYDLYLDAIRIYDPTGNENEVANDAYVQDKEAYPIYEELRNNIINTDKFFAEAEITEFADGVTYYMKDEDGNYIVATGEFSAEATYYTVNTNSSIYEENGVKGALFIDCNNATTSIADYISYGPNNELYLAKGQAIAFTVDVTETMADVQLGIKVGNGGSVTYEINGDSYTINTTTDMYYSIWEYVKDGDTVVTIKNTEGGILSLTNIKATFGEATSTNGLLRMTAGDAGNALMMLRKAPVVEEPTEPETEPTEPETEPTEPETEPTEPETEPTEPETEPTEPAKPDNSQLKSAVDAAKKLKEKDYTKESFKAVKNALKDAEKVLKNRKATQAEIDEALAELNEAVEELETKASAAKPGKNEKPGKENQNKPGSTGNTTTIEQQAEQVIVQIANLLFGWLFG